MTYKNMKVSNLNHGIGDRKSFNLKVILDGKQTTPWYVLPAGASSITVTVTPKGGAEGFVQTTTDDVNDIINEEEDNGHITAITWPKGLIHSVTQDTADGSFTAIRCTQTTAEGTIKFTGACS